MNRKPETRAPGEIQGALAVGALLRDRRESRGLTPDDVGQAIRFGTRQIVALEEGRLADLPPLPYARGLISAYATLVGLDTEELLRICGQPLPGQRAGRGGSVFRYPQRERFIWREWTIPFAFAAAVLVLAVARVVFAPAALEFSEPPSTPVAPRRPIQQAAAPAEITPPPDPSTAEPVPAPNVRVLLRCEGTTWVEASADGAERRRYELGPGQNLDLSARERLSLSLGDAGVIRIRVNGRELGFIGDKGEMKPALSFTAEKVPNAVASGAANGD